MSGLILDPGYREAVEREKSLRFLAMDGQPVPLCGRLVRQFCLRHLIRLGGLDSPFVMGGTADQADVALFLWVVSTEYSLDAVARESFYAEMLRIIASREAFLEHVAAIRAYLDGALIDHDTPGDDTGALIQSYFSWAAAKVVFFATRFGWDDDAILDKPVARILQYERVIMKNAGVPIANRSDRFLSQMLVERMQQRSN